jgi:serine O-acetyltransferase
MAERGAFHYDVEKYCLIICKTRDPGLIRKTRLLLTNMGLQCIAVYRFGRFAGRVAQRHPVVGWAVRWVHVLMSYLMVLVHKVDLHSSSEIGPGFHISHVGTVLIGPCRIGANCTVTHNVTIGLGFALTGAGMATIGKDVWIGTGSVIAGKVTVGDGATISAGSIVTRDVPVRCVVAGNPARVIARDYDNGPMLVYRMSDGRRRASDEAGQERLVLADTGESPT